MLPQVAVGGWTPIPKKLSEASNTIALPTCSVPATTIGANVLGTMCRISILDTGAPCALAAVT